MSAPLALNLQIIPAQRDEENVVYMSLSHYGTNSSVFFRCEFDDNQEHAKWGVDILGVRGDHFSYFGQFVGEMASDKKAGSPDPENGGVRFPELNNVSDYNRARLVALSKSMSYMLNELYQAKEGKNYISLDEVGTLNETVWTIRPDHQVQSEITVYLLPLEISQRDFAIGMARISPVFDRNQPSFLLADKGESRMLDSLLEEVERQEKENNQAH
jgi:hypothetical protein